LGKEGLSTISVSSPVNLMNFFLTFLFQFFCLNCFFHINGNKAFLKMAVIPLKGQIKDFKGWIGQMQIRGK